MEVRIGDNFPKEEDPTLPLIVHCGSTVCRKVVEIPTSELVACFGLAAGGGWANTTPPEVAACSPSQASCEVTLGEASLPLHDECGCAVDNGDDTCACCSYPTDSDTVGNQTWTTLGSTLLGALALCGIEAASSPAYCEEVSGDDCGYLEEQCGPSSTVSTATSSYDLTIDPALSWVELKSGALVDTAPLSGSATLRSGPNQALRAVVFGDDLTLAGYQYDDWMFWLTAPVSTTLTSNGQLSISTTSMRMVEGWGTRNAVPMNVLLTPQAAATGELNTSAGTWYLDFTKTSGVNRVRTRLAGALVAK